MCILRRLLDATIPCRHASRLSMVSIGIALSRNTWNKKVQNLYAPVVSREVFVVMLRTFSDDDIVSISLYVTCYHRKEPSSNDRTVVAHVDRRTSNLHMSKVSHLPLIEHRILENMD